MGQCSRGVESEGSEPAATYILRRTPEGLEIVFYLNHVDVPAGLSALSHKVSREDG